MTDLTHVSTEELVDELVNREGVKTIGVCSDHPVIVATDDDTCVFGPARVIVVPGVGE